MRVGISRTVATVQFHLRRAGTDVWVVEVASSMVLDRVPSLSRILGDFHPIVLAILDLARVLQRLSEELAEVIVVWGIFEAKVSDVCKILGKFFREAFAKILDCGRLLLFANFLILLFICSSLQALPGKAPPEEVHENMAKSLEVISSGLFASQMSIDTHVSGGS